MVIPTDVQVAFIVGAFFADIGARAIEAAKKHSTEHSRSLYSHYRFRALAYPAIFVGPAATTFMLGWPAWESQYWSSRLDATSGSFINASPYGIFLLLLFVGAWFGNWLGFRWVLSGARRRLRALYVSILILTMILVFVQWPAPIRLGSYEAFHNDPGALPYIWQDSGFFICFCMVTVYCAIPIVVWFIKVRRSVKTTNGA